MSTAGAGQLRTVAFGDLDTGIWGTASLTRGGSQATFGAGLTADGSGPADTWMIAGDAAELRFAPIGEPGQIELDDAGGLVQLCRVGGTLRHGSARTDVHTFGIRAVGVLPSAAPASARAALAWFGEEAGFALLATRPPRAQGHEGDSVRAVLFEGGAAVRISDPRLSTTYDGGGRPSRAGLELWLASSADDEQHPPRRAAGQAAGEAAAETAGTVVAPAAGGPDAGPAFVVRSQPFRWQMGGREGAGVYQLLGPR